MAGHSKWHNIKRKKSAQDAKRGKIFMRHAKNIYVAAKEGGGDLEANSALRTAVDNAKADNMPNENIERNIKKATGTLDGVNYEEITYEGYGPGGVAVIVHAITDNKNRTASEVRHAFSKHGGNLGESGSVSFMFDRKGYIVIENPDGEIDEDEITMEALEAGAEDIQTQDGAYEIFTEPDGFKEVREHFLDKNYHLTEAEVTLFPQTYTDVSGEVREQVIALIETLEENDDLQDIHHNLNESDV